jgi:hypothetical protein
MAKSANFDASACSRFLRQLNSCDSDHGCTSERAMRVDLTLMAPGLDPLLPVRPDVVPSQCSAFAGAQCTPKPATGESQVPRQRRSDLSDLITELQESSFPNLPASQPRFPVAIPLATPVYLAPDLDVLSAPVPATAQPLFPQNPVDDQPAPAPWQAGIGSLEMHRPVDSMLGAPPRIVVPPPTRSQISPPFWFPSTTATPPTMPILPPILNPVFAAPRPIPNQFVVPN